MDLQNFSKFSAAMQTLNEQSNAYPINEAIKSSILKDLSDLKGFRGWRNEFFKDFYNKFTVDLNELGDDLFTTVDASTAKQMMKRKERKMIFCIYDGSLEGESGSAGRRLGVAITLNGGALYNQHLVEICNEFIVLDIDTMQSQYSTQDLVDTRQEQKQGSAHTMSNRDVKQANMKRYKEILEAKVDPASIMVIAQEVAKTMFTKLSDAASGTPEDFANNFTKEHRWDGWSRNLGRILVDLGQELERYTRDYADYLKAAQEYAEEKQEKGDSEFLYGKYSVQRVQERFLDHKTAIQKLKSRAESL